MKYARFILICLIALVVIAMTPPADASCGIYCASIQDDSLCVPDDSGCYSWCFSGPGAAQCYPGEVCSANCILVGTTPVCKCRMWRPD
jgi:hypothetical protein